MTVWRVASGKQFVEYNGIGLRADPATAAQLEAYAGRPIQAASSSILYVPQNERDPVGLFLLARYLLGADATVTGSPPHTPAAPPVDPAADY